MKIRRAMALGALVTILTACGGGGGGDEEPSPPGNAVPTANAGADQAANEGATVTLAGSGTDSDGTIAGYAWTQTSGPTVALSSGSVAAPTFTAPAVDATQALVFTLTVIDDDGASAIDTVQVTVNDVPLVPLTVSSLELAQTHVLPPAGRSWTLPSANETLHFTGGRSALVLVGLSPAGAVAPRLEGVIAGVTLGSVALDPPASLPPTESSGPAYATDRWSATIPAAWVRPGLQFRVTSTSHATSALTAAASVGGDFPLRLSVLPFYLFGANETNTSRPLSVTGVPNQSAKQEMFAKWPIATLDAVNHPAGKVEWPYLELPPGTRSGVAEPARRATSTADYRDGFTGMGVVLGILGDLQDANGDNALPVQYYAPILALNATGGYAGAGGGLGSVGGGTSTGDETYSGIFIHEIGHAFGLSHAGEAFDDDRYPYEWGSLNGSRWGWDPDHREFLAPFLPSNASTIGACASDTFAGHPRAIDSMSRCVKQDPMQSGAGDQASGYRFATFSDFSTAVMQRWFEGVTSVASDGTHGYSGGKVVRDATFPGGYKRWDTVSQAWVNVTPQTASGGIFGLDGGLPITRDVPVYAIALTISNAGTAGATQIYPPIAFTGNLMRTFDPTKADDRAAFTPDVSTYYWYCRNGGCDYTLRVTFANLTKRNVLLQGGFRPFNQPRGTPPATAADPLNGDSFESFAVNVPNDGPIQRIELLSTPQVWEGMPLLPVVLAVR